MKLAKSFSAWVGRLAPALVAASLLVAVPATVSAQSTPPNTPPGVDH